MTLPLVGPLLDNNKFFKNFLFLYNSQALVARNNPPFFVNWFESQLNSKDFF
jgi:hypothetical protein